MELVGLGDLVEVMVAAVSWEVKEWFKLYEICSELEVSLSAFLSHNRSRMCNE